MNDSSTPPGPTPASPTGGEPGGQPPPSAKVAPPRRKRRWLRRLFFIGAGLFILLLVTVVAAPYALATRPGLDLIFNLVNNRIDGFVDAESAQLSWFAPVELRGVKISDGYKRELLKVESIRCTNSLLGFATGGLDFGEVVIDAPDVTLAFDEQNRITLIEALGPPEGAPPPAATESAAGLPAPRGRVVIRNGTLRAERGGAAPLALRDVQLDLKLETLAKIDGSLSLTFPDGVQARGTLALRDLADEREIRVDRVSGRVDLATTGEVQLEALTRVLTPTQPLQGAISLNLQADSQGQDVSARLAIQARGLQAGAGGGMSPANLAIDATAQRKSGQLAGSAKLTGDAGELSLDANADLSRPLPPLDAEKIVSALLTGAPLALPELTLTTNGRIDVARLHAVAPGLIPAQAGTQITAGRIDIEDVQLRGGPQPALRGAVAIRDLAGTASGRPIRVEPISLRVDSVLAEGVGLRVDSAELVSGFASLKASGSAANLKAEFRSSLSKLQQDLGRLIDLGAAQLAGELSGTLDVARPGADRVSVAVAAQGTGLRVASGQTRLDVQRLTLRQGGFVTLQSGRATRADLESLDIDLDGQVTAAARGWYDLTSSAFSAALDVKRADLGFAATRAAALGSTELQRYSGVITGSARAERADAAAPLVASGGLLLQNLGVDGGAILEGDTRIEWSNVQAGGADGVVRAANVTVTSSAAALSARNISLRSGGALDAGAELQASADLERLSRAIGRIAKMDKPPQIAGRLNLDATVAGSGGQVTARGRGGIEQLAVGAGPSAVREPRVTLDFDAGIDHAARRITLTRAGLASSPLTAEMSGTIEQFDGACNLALRGKYDAAWEQLTRILHELAPTTSQTVIVSGRSTSQFEIRGPLNQPAARPAFRGATGGVDVAWSAAELYGVKLGPATLKPGLRDGQFVLPTTAIAVAQGRVNLGGALDMTAADPTVRIPGALALLEGVEVTPLLGQLLLSRINPVFMQMTRTEGRVSLNVQDIAFPLGDSAKTSGQGKGRLDLATVKVQPSGFLQVLLELGGYGGDRMHAITFGTLDFVIRDGRVVYDNFTMTLPPDFDLRFRGSVGLDSTLDLIVSVPVRKGLLEKLGVKGPALAAAEQLTGLRVDIPVAGTRERPQLDLSKVDVKKLLSEAILKQKPDEGVKKILDILKPPAEKQKP